MKKLISLVLLIWATGLLAQTDTSMVLIAPLNAVPDSLRHQRVVWHWTYDDTLSVVQRAFEEEADFILFEIPYNVDSLITAVAYWQDLSILRADSVQTLKPFSARFDSLNMQYSLLGHSYDLEEANRIACQNDLRICRSADSTVCAGLSGTVARLRVDSTTFSNTIRTLNYNYGAVLAWAERLKADSTAFRLTITRMKTDSTNCGLAVTRLRTDSTNFRASIMRLRADSTTWRNTANRLRVDSTALAATNTRLRTDSTRFQAAINLQQLDLNSCLTQAIRIKADSTRLANSIIKLRADSTALVASHQMVSDSLRICNNKVRVYWTLIQYFRRLRYYVQ